jgi:hypothetical protein
MDFPAFKMIAFTIPSDAFRLKAVLDMRLL